MGGVSIMDVMYWTFPDRSGKWSIAAGKVDVLDCGLERLNVNWCFGTDGVAYPITLGGVRGTRWKEGPAVQRGVTPNDIWQTQVGGNHYTKLKIQPMQYSMANGLDALQHTVIKYVTRFRDKAGIVDLEKARQTLDLLIAFEKDKKNG